MLFLWKPCGYWLSGQINYDAQMAMRTGLFKNSFYLKQEILKIVQMPERLNFNIFDGNILFEIMLMMKENTENNLKILATKADLKEEIARLDVKISDVKSDIIRWVFAFFVATMLAIAGLYLKK